MGCPHGSGADVNIRGAVLKSAPGEYEVVPLELEDPRPGEVQVKLAAAGLCHSDDHVATGDLPFGIYPVAGGHEGSGVVVAVGANTSSFTEGDHVVFKFTPSCGRCRWCATGQQSLCDIGSRGTLHGARWDDPTSYRLRFEGRPVGQMSGVSTFCEYTTVAAESLVKIPEHIPLDKACLVSCGVGTGWGSAVNLAETKPGHTIIVMGIGGVGINAVQGARHAGATHIIAVDPVPFKRAKAEEMGATHSFATIEEATEVARSFTNGQGADAAIVTVGVTTPEHVGQAFASIRKAGTVVVTGLGKRGVPGIPIDLIELTLYQKRLQGSVFGGSSPNYDILRQLELYEAGVLQLDGLITTTYKLDDVAQGYRDMHAGKNIRGVMLFD
jgi:NDMA-dependent alcohol dehydrogenase